MKRIPIFLVVIFLQFSVAYSQPNLQDIVKSQSRIAGDLNNPAEGFGRKISGEDLLYHSTRQDCQNALLVRATDGKMNISWETPLINPNLGAKEVQLFLIAGMSLQGYDIKGVDPGFQVFINNKPYFHFKNSMGENWTANGPDGSRMIFQCTDALDWFLKKTSIDGWFDVQLTSRWEIERTPGCSGNLDR